MSWQLEVTANVADIAGALRGAVDDQIRHTGDAVPSVEMAQIEAVTAAAAQLAAGDYLGQQSVTVKASGHLGPEGLAEGATVTIAIVAHVGRFEPRYETIPPPTPAPAPEESTVPALLPPGTTGDAEGPLPGGPAMGVTTSASELAARAELQRIERDRAEAVQVQARIDEQARRVEESKEDPGWASLPEGVDQVGPTVAKTPVTVGVLPEALNPPAPVVDPATAAQLDTTTREQVTVVEPVVDAPAPTGDTEVLPPPPPLDATEDAPANVTDVDGQVVDASVPQPSAEGSDAPAATAPTVDSGAPETTPSAGDNRDDIDDPGETTKAALQALAEEHGLPTSGTKAELLDRLHDAGVAVPPSDG